MSQNGKPLLLTVREVAELLRIHRPKVYDLIKAGTIDGFKLGSDWRIRRESIEKLIGTIPDGFFERGKEVIENGHAGHNEDDEIESVRG